MKNANTLHIEGLKMVQAEDFKSAVSLFLKAIALAPQNPIFYNNLGTAYKKLQQDAPAMKAFQQALELNKNYAEAHNNAALLYQKEGRKQKALEHYSQAVNAVPDFMIAHYNLGLLLLQTQDYASAMIQFKNVLTLDPANINAQFYLGVLELEAHHLKEAEAWFQSVILAEPYHSFALSNLGIIALKKEEGQLALAYFTKALAVDNKNIEARNNMAATFMHYDRFENALTHYEILMQEDPSNIEYRYNAGVAQMVLGHLQEAIVQFNRVLQAEPKHFAALNNLAAIYSRLDDKVKAQALLEEAVLVNPEDKPSQHMLKALDEKTGQAETCIEYAGNLFNNYSLYYDKHVKEVLHYSLPEQIKKILESYAINKVDRTLDLGCGTGLIGEIVRPISKQLTGVDIAAKMLDRARNKGIYDALIEADLLAFFKKDITHYNLILAADVFPYFGDLEAIFAAVKNHLANHGNFIFTTEISHSLPWILQTTARFAHHPDYLQALADKYHLTIAYQAEVIGRRQDKKGLPLLVMVLQALD